MQIDMNTLYMRQLSVFGTRGMPAWRYPTLLSLIETGRIDVSPIVARTVPLSRATDELRAFDGPTAPGVAVITDFAVQPAPARWSDLIAPRDPPQVNY
jgi:threonine dehydrogenase-like Zn-dependent dehydrogenase